MLAGAPVNLLGQIPMSVALREGSDAGMPVAISHPDDVAAVSILAIAEVFAKTPIGLANRKLGLRVEK
jgi:ATP-binding protein involved in chromosome partitioning